MHSSRFFVLLSLPLLAFLACSESGDTTGDGGTGGGNSAGGSDSRGDGGSEASGGDASGGNASGGTSPGGATNQPGTGGTLADYPAYEVTGSVRADQMTALGGSSSAGVESQIPLTLDTQGMILDGSLEADGSNLRFLLRDDCSMELCFWVEEGWDTDSTKLWVRVPARFDGNDEVLLALDETGAWTDSVGMGMGGAGGQDNPIGDARCTFELYDDFSGSTLDTNVWTDDAGGQVNTVSGGELRAVGGGYVSWVYSKASFDFPIAFHARWFGDGESDVNISAGPRFTISAPSDHFGIRSGASSLSYHGLHKTPNSWVSQTWVELGYPNTAFADEVIYLEPDTESDDLVLAEYCMGGTCNGKGPYPLSTASGTGNILVGFSGSGNDVVVDETFVRRIVSDDAELSSLGDERACR